jgi:MFS family permease
MGYCVKELAYSLILCLGSLTFGVVMGFPSAAIPAMKADWGEDAVSEISWTFLNSITALTAIFGPFVTKLLLSPLFKFGRRTSCFIIAITGAAFWLIMLGHDQNHFYVGLISRALLGITIGAFSALQPMYIVEIAPPDATGFFGTLAQLAVASGFVVVYLVSEWLNWKLTAVVGAIICGALALLVWLVPKSPADTEETSTSTSEENNETTESVFSGTYLCPLLVCVGFMFFQQLSGINAILTNLTELFNRAKIDLSGGYASAITAVAQVIATLSAGFMVEKLGRKFVWILSFGLVTLTNLLFGLANWPGLSDKFGAWAPIIVIFLNLLGFGLGAGPIPWFIVSEMFPTSVRATAVSIVSTSNWIIAFAVLQAFPSVMSGIGLHGAMIMFSAVSLIGTVFGLFYVKNPELVDEKLEQRKSTGSLYENVIVNDKDLVTA